MAAVGTLYTVDGIPTGFEEEIRWRVNRGRFDTASENQTRGTSYTGLPATAGPLAPNQSITLAARHHSEDMATHNVFQHATVSGSAYYNPTTQPNPWDRMQAEGYSWNNAGENIAGGYGGPEAVYVGWWNSQGHRANMYNSALREIGNGYYYLASATYRSYWTMDLGSSGSSCFFTDTLFRDANSNSLYESSEAVTNVAVKLLVGSAPQSYYDLSSPVGSFAVPLSSIPTGSTVQVALSNANSSPVTITVPRDYHNLTTLTLSAGEQRVHGIWVKPGGAQNAGFRDLTPANPPVVSASLASAFSGSGVSLSWPSVVGQKYQVQWTTNLVSWIGLGNTQTGTGDRLSATDATQTQGARRFYRLQISSP
jgi:hypothetical protein